MKIIRVIAALAACCLSLGGCAHLGPDSGGSLRTRSVAGETLTPKCPLLDADTMEGRPPSVGSVALVNPPLRVHYCDEVLRPMAERTLAAAKKSLRAEMDELGFPAPLPDGVRGGGPEFDVYLVNLGRGGRAQDNEEPERTDSVTAPSYVIIDYRTTEANDLLASYVAHEMSHGLQYSLGLHVAGPFMEATSAWIDDHVYPRANVLAAMVADFQRAPHHPLYFHDELSCYDYGAAMFVDYLVHRFGMGVVLDVFRRDEKDFIASLARVLTARSANFPDVVRQFALARVRTGRYARAEVMPGWQRFAEVTLDRAVSPYEFLDQPLEVKPQRAPEELGSSYLAVDLITPLSGGLRVDVKAAAGASRLAVDLLSSDEIEPLASALLVGGAEGSLRADQLRPGARLWLVVTNLGAGEVNQVKIDREDPGTTALGYTATFHRLPEPESIPRVR